ncbi:MAG: hypothetical protein V3V22_04180 [Methylococcales bacterium]
MKKDNKKNSSDYAKLFFSVRNNFSFGVASLNSIDNLIMSALNSYPRLLWLLLIIMQQGCAVKTFIDPANIPENQLPTIQLKTPATALIPLFWIPPLNLLNWLADDWRETSSFTSRIYMITETGESLTINRFSNFLVLPGTQELYMEDTATISSRPIGSESCSFSKESCTTKKEDGESVTTCEDEYHCSRPVRNVVEHKRCKLQFNAEPNQIYEVFIRNKTLMLTNENGINPSNQAANCDFSTEEHDSTETRDYTSPSSNHNHDC